MKKNSKEINLSRRNLIKGAGLVAVANSIPSLGHAQQGTCVEKKIPAWDKPYTGSLPEDIPNGYNILLITTDQERHFEQYPFPVPGRERLRKMGVTFNHHQNNSNVCTPSRSVMYTGLHIPHTKMFDNLGMPWMPYDLNPKLKTIGHMMKELGYYSAYKGKWHLTEKLNKPIPNKKPQDIDVGDIPTPELHNIMETYGFSDYHGIGDIIGHSKGGYFYDSITTGQTINWLRSKGRPMTDSSEPWFLAVNLVNPHDVMFIDTDNKNEKVQWKGVDDQNKNTLSPTQPPNNALYNATWPNWPLPENRHQRFDQPGRPIAHKYYQDARASMVGDFPDEDRRWRKLLDYYFNCIRDNDTHLVNILDELDALNLTEKTIIVFTSDHGELGGSHQMHGKGSSIYKEQINVPLIISHPAYPGNKTCKALTCHLDLVPTLVGLTGIDNDKCKKVLRDRKGHDLSKILKSPDDFSKNSIRESSLYCFNMILYTDENYLKKIKSIQNNTTITPDEVRRKIALLSPDYTRRTGIRMINDGRYKFARYFSLREHNTPNDWGSLLKFNDIELYDTLSDPNEDINMAVDKENNKELILLMNRKLNNLISAEVGIDDGSFMPSSDNMSWNLTLKHFNRMAND